MAAMLRVAYLFERFPSFGQTFCYREVAELLRQGADVTIFSIRRPIGEPPETWDEAIVRRVHYLPEEADLVKEIGVATRRRQLPAEAIEAITEWDRRSDFLRLYQAAYIGLRLRDAGITRIHAHFAGMAARTAYWLRQFFGVEYSLTAHANDVFAPREFAVSLAKIFDAAMAIVSVSDFSAAQLKERFPGSAAKIHRIYNGIQLDAFRRSDFASAPPLIISVGRLIEKKGFADLIRACAILRDDGVAFRCEIIGEGPLRASLEQQIRDARLQDCVQLAGAQTQTEIVLRFASANVFALACTTEHDGGMDNLPTVIMEAMAAGLPVVSTRLAGVPEMVQEGVTGELVSAGDDRALAAAIGRVLMHRGTAARYGEAGRARAARKFSIETNVRLLAALL